MARLITVGGSRIELEPGASCVLGRGRDCDVVVEDSLCSRKHARILVPAQMDTVLLEDLGSQNGTFLNERKIDGRARLERGDRVRIGTSVFLFRSEEQPEDIPEVNLADTKTIAFEDAIFGRETRTSRVLKTIGNCRADLAGHLEAIGLLDLLQLLMRTRRSGTLHLALVTGSAQIEVRNGDVLAANYDEMEGFPALCALARFESGIFWFVDTLDDCVQNIEVPSCRLLVELCKWLDEGARV